MSRETSEERTDNGADRLSSERDNGVVQNGECESKEGQEAKCDSDKKVTDLKKSESLMNGQIKDETSKHGEDKEGVIKTEVKVEKEDKEKKSSEHSKGSDSEKPCTQRNVKKEIKTETWTDEEESYDQDKFEPKIKREGRSKSHSCNGHVEETSEKLEESENSKASSPTPPKDLPPLYDPSAFIPRLEDFELVVTSVEQLRELIKKFGDLPEANGGEEGKEGQKKSKVWTLDTDTGCRSHCHTCLLL